MRYEFQIFCLDLSIEYKSLMIEHEANEIGIIS
jgi:hypothetical protein